MYLTFWQNNIQKNSDKMNNNITQSDVFSLYLNICNRALASNKDRFPYKQILEALQSQTDNSNVEVEIIDDHPGVAHVISFRDNKIIPREPCQCVNPTCKKKKWRVTRTYLESVTNNPDEYISNPAKMDWEWILDSADN